MAKDIPESVEQSEQRFHIRKATGEEIEEMLRLWESSHSKRGITDTKDDLRRLRTITTSALLVLRLDGRLVGSIIVTFDGWRGNIYRLVVDPRYRRQGIATRLLAAANGTLQQWGAKRVSAVVLEENLSAVSFWESTDYVRDRTLRFVRNL